LKRFGSVSRVRAWTFAFFLLASCKHEKPLRERADAAAERAIDYFVTRGPVTLKTTLFALDYERRKFGIARLAPVVERWDRGNEHEMEMMKPLAQWIDPSIPFLEGGRFVFRTAIERVLYDGLHCRQPFWKLEDFMRDLDKAIESKDFGVTHAAMASELARENGCVSAEQLSGVRARMVKELEAIAEKNGDDQDLLFEAVAMLDYLGERARVKPEWVERVIAAQLPNGGFALLRGTKASHDHPSVLALWVLLEAAHPDAAPMAWIPRATN
jgi:hypothetical protein